MIKLLYTSITLLTVFCEFKHVRFAYITEVFILIYIESNDIITFELGFSLIIDSFICGINNCSFIGVFHDKNHQNHIERAKTSCKRLSSLRVKIHNAGNYHYVEH